MAKTQSTWGGWGSNPDDENREQVYVDEFLRLTVTDARALTAALEYLIATASRDD